MPEIVSAIVVACLMLALLKLRSSLNRYENDLKIIEKLKYNGFRATAEIITKIIEKKWVEGEYPACFITYKFQVENKIFVTRKPIIVSHRFFDELKPTFEIEVLYDEKNPNKNYPEFELEKRIQNKKKTKEVIFWSTLVLAISLILMG